MNSINAVIGPPGCGKTCYMTVWARHLYDDGFDLFSNYHFKRMKYTPIDNLEDFSKIDGEKVAIFLDEIHKSADARESQTPLNKFLTGDIMQHRKWGQDSHVFGSEQLENLMDCRLRGVVSRVHMPSIVLRLPDMNWQGKTLRGKPLLMRLMSYLTSDPFQRIEYKKIPLVRKDGFIVDEFDTRQRIGKIAVNYHVKFIEQLKENYSDIPLTKQGELAEEIMRREEARKSFPNRDMCMRAARQILNDRLLHGA